MVRILIFMSVALLVIIGLYLLKKAHVFLPLIHDGEPDETIQFLHQFGIFYLILAAIGILVGIFNLTFFLCSIFLVYLLFQLYLP